MFPRTPSPACRTPANAGACGMWFDDGEPVRPADEEQERTLDHSMGYQSRLWRFTTGANRHANWWICDKCHEHLTEPPTIEEDPL